MGDVIVQKLDAAGQDKVSRFRMADDFDLQNFLRRHSRKSAAAQLTTTYVAKLEGSSVVIGYVSLMCAEVKLEQSYAIEDKQGADRYVYQPAVRIARLAVSDDFRGHALKVGTKLLYTAIGIAVDTIQPHIGCRFIVLDAKKKSIGFYEQNGFILLDTPVNRETESPTMFMDLRSLA
jgi:predicted GNAT family N-acyltransferase